MCATQQSMARDGCSWCSKQARPPLRTSPANTAIVSLGQAVLEADAQALLDLYS